MNEERTLILEMLAAGKIDVAQANELLDGLEPSSAAAPPPPSTRPPPLRLSPEQLLELRDHDLDARFVRSVHDANLGALSFEDVLELGIHEVPPKFIRELRETYPDITTEQMIELHNHDIDTDYLRDLREADLLSRDPAGLIRLKEEHGS